MSSGAPTRTATSRSTGLKLPALILQVWQWAVRHPCLTVLLILACQTLPTFWSRDLYDMDELRHAGVLFEILEHGNWLALHLNGQIYADKPPIYFWLLAASSWIFQTDRPAIFYLVTALSAALYLMATYGMARLVVRGDRELGLIACLMMLTTPFFIEMSHYPRMDLLFGAFIALSLTCFFIACRRPRALGWTLAGFAIATLAVLTKGPFGLLFPLLTVIAFLAWQGRLSRLLAIDFAAGAILSAVVLGAYVWGLYQQGGLDYLQSIIRYLEAKTAPDEAFQFRLGAYLHWHASRWLPWTLLVFFLPWRQLTDRAAWASTLQSSDESRAGWVFLGLSVVGALLPLSLISYASDFFLLTFYPALTVLAAVLLRSFSAPKARRFATTVAAVLLVLSVALPVLSYSNRSEFPVSYSPLIAVVAFAGALLLLRFRRNGAAPFFSILALCTTFAMQLHFLVSLPATQHMKGMKASSEIVSDLVAQGYTPIAFSAGFGGYFQYYMGRRLPEYLEWEGLNAALRRHDRAVIVMSRGDWDEWPDRPAEAGAHYASHFPIQSLKHNVIVYERPGHQPAQ